MEPTEKKGRRSDVLNVSSHPSSRRAQFGLSWRTVLSHMKNPVKLQVAEDF
jgi:hypothetical protein